MDRPGKLHPRILKELVEELFEILLCEILLVLFVCLFCFLFVFKQLPEDCRNTRELNDSYFSPGI